MYSFQISITIFKSAIIQYTCHLHVFLFKYLSSHKRTKHRDCLPDLSLVMNQDFCNKINFPITKPQQISAPWLSVCPAGSYTQQAPSRGASRHLGRVQPTPAQPLSGTEGILSVTLYRGTGGLPGSISGSLFSMTKAMRYCSETEEHGHGAKWS